MKKGITAQGYKEPAADCRRLSLTFSETALLKTAGLIEAFDGEVGWHGTVKRIGKASFNIEDVFVYPQDASSASVDTRQHEYEQWLYAQPKDVFDHMRMHGHSHVRFGVIPSAKDDTHRNKLVSQLVGDMFYIFMIWNKRYEICTLIYDCDSGILYDNRHITVYAMSCGKRIALSDLKIWELKRQLTGGEIGGFINSAKIVVRTSLDETAPLFSLICSKAMYSLLEQYAGQVIRLSVENSGNAGAGLIRLIREEDGKELMALANEDDFASIYWSASDVQRLRPDLTDDECKTVLKEAERKHDATMGITWDTLKIYADEFFGTPEKSEMLRKFIRNSIVKLAASAGSEYLPSLIDLDCVIDDKEIFCRIAIYQDVEKKRQYHYWYGGNVVLITLTRDEKTVSGEITANGDIRVRLRDKEGTVLCDIKDKSNEGGFYELSRYIPDDGTLSGLLDKKENKAGFDLTVEDNNWWELFIDGEDASSVVLDDYTLTDALAEAAAHLFGMLKGEDGENEHK